MKKAILIIILAVVIIGGIVGVEIYLAKSRQGSVALAPESAGLESQGRMRVVAKDDFSLQAPEGWLEAGAPVGVSLMLVNSEEQTTNSAANKINFKSYLSVGYDTLVDNTREQYLEVLKSNLRQSIPGVVFTNETALSINGRQTDVLELELSQQGVNFNVLMFVVSGEGKDVWVISFNTLKESWDTYEDLFYQIAGSFKVK